MKFYDYLSDSHFRFVLETFWFSANQFDDTLERSPNKRFNIYMYETRDNMLHILFRKAFGSKEFSVLYDDVPTIVHRHIYDFYFLLTVPNAEGELPEQMLKDGIAQLKSFEIHENDRSQYEKMLNAWISISLKFKQLDSMQPSLIPYDETRDLPFRYVLQNENVKADEFDDVYATSPYKKFDAVLNGTTLLHFLLQRGLSSTNSVLPSIAVCKIVEKYAKKLYPLLFVPNDIGRMPYQFMKDEIANWRRKGISVGMVGDIGDLYEALKECESVLKTFEGIISKQEMFVNLLQPRVIRQSASRKIPEDLIRSLKDMLI